ncbi:glucose/arabinose dehydrogenase [Actinoalloteichus hoggarensis]|uniref:Glucose/Sorbosone dehydrogenase domain-containing protein n=1 Tax=Actinoalloteichus hoggarensis TaxID=1470176 RepID=A0A221W9V1_9PSEU|nr:PQQ-dependent sugar dehydrogenase [Actinoalloteichus hoggarensis]ASO22386.1 hypothetical protein AHOG_23900 [Actinoalloteichus hoggarensis]MBB5923191.1 glucose/arabinose dehydrogenase [Actinoalloteichus hoggarensis]
MPSSPNQGRRGRRSALAGFVVLGLVAAGCADFSQQERLARAEWEPAPPPMAGSDNAPRFPDEGGGHGGEPGRSTSPAPVPPPEGCTDYDPAVVVTCLDPVSSIAVLPDGEQALVAERATGRILRVRWGRDPADKDSPEEFATVAVDASEGGGGLLGLALSPYYAEDSLVYALLSTPEDNRVVRIAAGDEPKPVLTGLPRDPAGALTNDLRGALLLATGSAGDPAAAADPDSQAGKVLRIDETGAPAADNPDPTTAVVSSGLAAPAGLCQAVDGSSIWVTDRAESRDLLYRIEPGEPLGEASWNWPDQPGVAGCAAYPDMVTVFLSDQEAIANLELSPDLTFASPPQYSGEGTYGRFSGAAPGLDDYIWVGTENQAGGDPASSDDRVVLIDRLPTPGGGGRD